MIPRWRDQRAVTILVVGALGQAGRRDDTASTDLGSLAQEEGEESMLVTGLIATVLTAISTLLLVEGVWLVRAYRASLATHIYFQRPPSDRHNSSRMVNRKS